MIIALLLCANLAAPPGITVPICVAEVDTQFLEEELEYIGSMCSLACAVCWTVDASTELAPQGDNWYTAEMLDDGDISTAWVEGLEGDGAGAEIRFVIDDYFADDPDFDPAVEYPLYGLSVLNGYRKNTETWEANGRVRSALVSCNGDQVCVIELLDTMDLQWVSIPDVIVSHGDTVAFEILETYPGSRWNDTAITELVLMGAH